MASTEVQRALHLHRQMERVRAFELAAAKVLAAGELSGTLHLSVGQEAVAVGVCSELELTDSVTTTHRGHGHCLAKGADPGRMLAELFGSSAGYCKGRSGSMHIADTSVGIVGANAIVGAGIPIAVGAALSSQIRQDGSVAVTFFGEGATGEGSLHESLNLAALWKLPVIFVCENNQYAELSHISDVLAARHVSDLGKPFGIPSVTADGNDIDVVTSETRAAVTRARAGEGPTLLEFETYRQSGHYEGDAQRYRSKEERVRWLERDPILNSRVRLMGLGIEQSEIDEIAVVARTEMQDAVSWARQQPKAGVESIYEDVYADFPVGLRWSDSSKAANRG